MLETPRLLLRPMRIEDTADLLHIFTDPQVLAAFDARPFDQQQMERWVKRNLDHQEQYGYGLFSVILKANGLLIGDCGLEHMVPEGKPEIEFGYDFRSDYWNQGLATEAAAAIRDYAFQTLQLPRLISLIRHNNTASQRVAEKIGMHRTTEISRYDQKYWSYARSC